MRMRGCACVWEHWICVHVCVCVNWKGGTCVYVCVCERRTCETKPSEGELNSHMSHLLRPVTALAPGLCVCVCVCVCVRVYLCVCVRETVKNIKCVAHGSSIFFF